MTPHRMPWTKFRKAVEIGDPSFFQRNSHGASQLLSESEGSQLWCVPDQPMGNLAWNPKKLLENYDTSHALGFQEALGESELVVHVKTRLHNFQSLEQHLYTLQANHDIKKILLVTGDGAQVGDLTTRHALEYLSKNCPDLFGRMDFAVAWGGGTDARHEMWLEEKLEFGATAVFTQPCWSEKSLSEIQKIGDTELWHQSLNLASGSSLLGSLKTIPIFPGVMRTTTAQQWSQFWQAQLHQSPFLGSLEKSKQESFHKRLCGVFGRYWTPQSDLDYMVE